MNARRFFRAAVALAAIMASAGVSLHYERPVQPVIGTLPAAVFENVRISFTASPLHAAGASDWTAVRGVTTFTRNLVESINATLLAFSRAGLFNWSATGSWTNDSDGNRYRMTIQPGGIQTGPYGAKSYDYIFEAWKISTSTKILEFYFNKPDSANAGEIMIVYSANASGDVTAPAAARLLCQATGNIGSRTMICSLGSGTTGTQYSTAGANLDAVKLRVAEAAGDLVGFKAVARTTVAIPTSVVAGCNSAPEYYGIAFIASKNSPYYTTARQAWGDTAVTPGYICSLAYSTYAFFNTTGTEYFVGEGSGAPSASYPAPSDVNALLTSLAGSGTAETDVTAAAVDAMMSGFATQVDFKLSTGMPPL